MLQKGFIEETADWNGWSSPVFLLRKPGPPRVNVLQQFRLIVDYRILNKCTQQAFFAPPCIKTMIGDMQGNKVFSKSDWLSGYYQQSLKPEDRFKTAFTVNTPTGKKRYQFRTSCLGLSGAVSSFQKWAERVIDGIPNCRAYLDDLIIYTKTMDEHCIIYNTTS